MTYPRSEPPVPAWLTGTRRPKKFTDLILFGRPDQCWPWMGAKQGSNTYGLWRGEGAHRQAYRSWRGHIPPKMLVCHHCDNPPCCNPNHLFVGTNRDNILDALHKGRLGNRWFGK